MLLYFSDADDFDNGNTGVTHSSGHCDVYATVTEVAVGNSVTVCGGGKRKRHVYTSTANTVQIYFDEQIGNERDFAHFVMEYGGIISNNLFVIRALSTTYICSKVLYHLNIAHKLHSLQGLFDRHL